MSGIIAWLLSMQYTDDAVSNLPDVFSVKPAVATKDDLPATGNKAGDVRKCIDTGDEYYWDSEAWEPFGPTLDTELSTTSERGVQNKVVKAAIDNAVTLIGQKVGEAPNDGKLYGRRSQDWGEVSLILPELTVITERGFTVTATCGDTVLTGVATDGSVKFELPHFGTWRMQGTDGEDYTQESVLLVAEITQFSVTLNLGDVYGVEWDKTSNPQLSRINSAALFTDPVPYVDGATNYGSPFDHIEPWSDMEIVEDEVAGDLVKIPKFYFKITDGTTFKIQISNSPRPGYHVSPAHADRGDGKGERDVVYVGRYHCDATYKSTSGEIPGASMTRATARSKIHELGSTYWQSDYAMRMTIWLLYIVEFAHFNSQAKIGYGCGQGSAVGKEPMGASDDMPYHTGTPLASRTTYGVGVQYRYIEGLWDNVLDWCDGIYFNGANVYGIKNPAQFSDNAGGTLLCERPTSNNWIKYLTETEAEGFDGWLWGTEAGGSGDTYLCDYQYQGGTVLYVGGHCVNQSTGYGLLYLGGDSNAGSTYAVIGCRLQKLP